MALTLALCTAAFAPSAFGTSERSYGAFKVRSETRAVLLGDTDAYSPRDFARLLADHPGIEVLELEDAPGTLDDRANFQVARMIRRHSIDTVVPAGGSARSGAVELFLAGARRYAHPSAEFAVHSWRNSDGRQAHDYAPNDPLNRVYLDYYVEMGLSPDQSRRFYDMTNSVPFEGARWLSAGEMRKYVEFAFVE